MPYEISWYKDKRIIHARFYDTLTLEEMRSFFEELKRFRESGVDPVHVLSDVRSLKRFPMSLPAIREVIPVLDGLGVDVLVGDHNPMIQFMVTVVAQFSNLELRQARTIDTALDILARLDPSLNDLPDKPSV